MSRAALNDPEPDVLTELYVLRSYALKVKSRLDAARKLTEATDIAQAVENITDAIAAMNITDAIAATSDCADKTAGTVRRTT